jgi:hypothetical protein
LGRYRRINQPAAHLQPTWLTDVFMLYYTVNMLMSWYNFVRAFQRTAPSSSRGGGWVICCAGSLAPTLGSFPFLLFTSGFAARHTLTFWSLSVMANFAGRRIGSGHGLFSGLFRRSANRPRCEGRLLNGFCAAR